jgi:hypothetical protein
MVVNPAAAVETEVFGVTYERYALQALFARLTAKLNLKSVLEWPVSGAKAMPGIYSLGFALAGCQVTLVDADETAIAIWRNLRLDDRLTLLSQDQILREIETGRRWNLCWNFAVLPGADDPTALIKKMASATDGWLLSVNVNRFNVGFAMHRSVHRFWKIPWSHGDITYFSPFQTCRLFRGQNYRQIHWGVVDCPPWPDSPGFRDLRLHRQAAQERGWASPYVDYLQSGDFPGWIPYVYFIERLPLPKVCKLPYSHLYYSCCRVK